MLQGNMDPASINDSLTRIKYKTNRNNTQGVKDNLKEFKEFLEDISKKGMGGRVAWSNHYS